MRDTEVVKLAKNKFGEFACTNMSNKNWNSLVIHLGFNIFISSLLFFVSKITNQ